MKTPMVENKDYILYFEFINRVPVFHCDVFKWNKSVKINLIKDFNILCSQQKKDVYCFMEPSNTKLMKFARLLGFEHFKKFTGTDEMPYLLFLRRI